DGLDRSLDLRLGRFQRNAESHLVVLGPLRRLLRHHRTTDDRQHLGFVELHDRLFDLTRAAHFKRSTRCSTAALVRTKVSRRRMSYTLAPCCGSTSTFGMLRAASANFSSTAGPSITRTEERPRVFSFAVRSLVLPLAPVVPFQMISLPSFTLDESAVF